MKKTPLNLSEISDEQLLKMKICDLPISINSSPFKHCIEKLRKELLSKGLLIKPKIWISDDWFCPDGITGFAVPFYLMDPRLMELEKKMIGFVEGENDKWFMQLLRHECGHAIDNAYFLKDCFIRDRIFGDSLKKYPTSYIPQKNSKSFVLHLEDNYAQAHPDEDWAETFAVWLTPRSNWRKKYSSWPAMRKLIYLDKKMKELSLEKPNVICNLPIDEKSDINYTLEHFYTMKRRRLGIKSPQRVSIKHIGTRVSRDPVNGIYLHEILQKNHAIIKRQVAKRMNQYQYRIERVMFDLSEISKAKGLVLKGQFSSKKDIVDLTCDHALKFFKEGKHRVIM